MLHDGWQFLRAHAGGVAGSLCGLVILMMVLVPHDGTLHNWIMHERPDALARLARGGREWGKFFDTLLICGGLFALGLWRRRAAWRRAALAAFLAASCAGLSANLVRATVGRTRPHEQTPHRLIGPSLTNSYQSFPSGHAATSGGYAVALAVALPALAPLALLSGGWVVWSSFYAGSHYLSDILASLWLCGWIGLALGLAARRRNRTTTTPASTPGNKASVRPAPRLYAPETPPQSRTVLTGCLPLLLLGALLLLPGLATLPLMDRDEPRFAQATREMQQRNDWVIPTFNDDYRFDKPPLTYWLMAPGYRLLGDTEAGARLHSVLSTLLLAMLVFAFGRTMGLRRDAATGAAAAMLFSVQFLAHGRAAVADLPMVLGVTATHYALYALLCRSPGRSAARQLRMLLCLSLCLGFLAKGPIAWLTPMLAMGLFRWVLFRGHPLPWRRLGLAWVAPLAVLGVAIWGIPALRRTQGEFWDVGIGFHVVERGVTRFHGRLFVPFYYPLTALLSLFPWSTRIGEIWRTLRSQGVQGSSPPSTKDPRVAFLIAWLAAPMLIFLFYATQLPHYTLPGFPAFFLLLGLTWNRASTPPLPRWGLRLRQVLLGISALGSILLLAGAPLMPPGGWRLILAGAGLALGGLTLAPVLAPRAFPLRLLPAALIVGIGISGVATGLRDVHVVLRLQQALDALPPETACHVLNYREPSLVFYSRRRWTSSSNAQTVAAALRSDDPVCVVVLEQETRIGTLLAENLRRRLGRTPRPTGRDYRDGHDPLPTDARIASVEGLSPARGVIARLALYANHATTRAELDRRASQTAPES